ncbi:hypothetical protein L1987_36807 [Smallanthus sonchifolius]|uniref:Uncharacterized protein n=1 Tax=Smallanthus sonchifolius TaxID=185202 RepID=A0ACB9HFU9_9ASTR|nr:hypothetical protein L1987_36807 [Smallanthus sonchifolius]
MEKIEELGKEKEPGRRLPLLHCCSLSAAKLLPCRLPPPVTGPPLTASSTAPQQSTDCYQLCLLNLLRRLWCTSTTAPAKKHRKATNKVNQSSKLCSLRSSSLFYQSSSLPSNSSPFVHRHRFQMKTVSGKIVSTKPVNLSKAANILSNFVTSDNGASQPVAAYLRRASAAFNELVYFKKHHRINKSSSTKSDISHRSLQEDEVMDTREVEGTLRKKERKKKKTDDNVEVGFKEGNETVHVKIEEKKKKKRKNAEVDMGEIGHSATLERKKMRRTEADD